MTSILLYLRIALKNQLSFFISIFSLTIGLSVCLLVYRFVHSESTYDTVHSGYKDIYRMTIHIKLDALDYGDGIVQFPMAAAMKADYPGVESTAKIYRNTNFPLLQFEDVKFVEEKLLFVDSNFFSFFAFPLIKGDYGTALSQSNSIVLTQRAASKYFDETDPMGKTLLFDKKYPLVVTGIIDETKIKSHINFDVLVPMAFQTNLWRTEGTSAENEEGWLRTVAWTYIKFRDQEQKEYIEKQLPSFVKKYFPENLKDRSTLGLQPLAEIHTSSHFDTEIEPSISKTYLTIFLFIIGAILVFSTVNFVNLNTSILLNRAKEFAVKGILGSSKIRLLKEIFMSTFIITFVSLMLAVVAAVLLQHKFNSLMQVNLEPISIIDDAPLLLLSLGFVLLISLISSLQSFFTILSGTFLGVIRDTKSVSNAIRKLAVGVQITCSFVLIFGTLIVFKQIGFMMSFDLGFNKENIIALPARPSIQEHYEAFKNEVKKITKVKNVSWTSDIPGTGGALVYRFVPEGVPAEKPMFVPMIQADYDFIETMNIHMKDGREFDASLPGDVGQTYIVNQAFLEKMDWRSEYLGKKIQMYTPGTTNLGFSGKIIGTFDDFHTESLHFPVKPLIIALPHAYRNPGSFLIKVESVDTQLIKQIEQAWKNFENEWPFEYQLVDNELNRLYENESRLFSLTMILSILAILISFFGLFGTNSVSIIKKYKAIAIKKVLGAHPSLIFQEVMRSELSFLVFVFIAAAPLGYYLVNNWLNGFQYRIRISYVDFLETAILIFLLVAITLLYHLLKMVKTNPLKHISRE